MCFEEGWFYATGSHALGRATPDHQPSRHHVYRLRLDRDNLAAKADISHAVEPLIENDGLLARHYRKRLNAVERGLDIEGIAARASVIGLRIRFDANGDIRGGRFGIFRVAQNGAYIPVG